MPNVQFSTDHENQTLTSANFLSNCLIETSSEGEHPSASSIYGAVAFCDISGFTFLANEQGKRGPQGIDSLGKMLNNHYSDLISTMTNHGGDVIAIIGDAALVLFTDFPISSAVSDRPTRYENSVLAGHCARAMHACLDALGGGKGGLPMHIGISCGLMHALHVGGWQGKAQFLLVGEPLKDLQRVVAAARTGTVCVSDQVKSLLNVPGSTSDSFFTFTKVASGDWSVGRSLLHSSRDLTTLQPSASSMLLWNGGRTLSTRHDILLSAYLCDSIVGRYLGLDNAAESSDGVDWLAEWRRLTIIFVKLRGFETIDSKDSVQQIHQCFVAVQKAVHAHDGSLLHAFHDDKGVVAVIVFGLPLKAHENDPSRAVACALSLQADLGRRGTGAAMGIATGHVLCGCLGSSKRKDFTVLGPLVNLAARFMSVVTESASSILCDDATKQSSEDVFSFMPPRPVPAKGFSELIDAYQPIEPGMSITTREESKSPNFIDLQAGVIGREREISLLNDAAEEWASGLCPVIVVAGDAGMGKSTLTSATLASLESRIVAATANLPKAPFGSHRPSLPPTLPVAQRRAVFYVKTDPFLSSDFQAWAHIMAQAIDFLIDEKPKDVGALDKERWSSPVGLIARHSLMIIQSFIKFLFTRRFPGLVPYLSLLNPLLHTRFIETEQCEKMAAEPRSECIFEICQGILSAVLLLAPVCICIEDAHALDPSSWTFACQLAKWCFRQNRIKREVDLVRRRSSIVEGGGQAEQAIVMRRISGGKDGLGGRSSLTMRNPRFSTSTKSSSGLPSRSSSSGLRGMLPDLNNPLFVLINTRNSPKDFRFEDGYQAFLDISRELCVMELSPISLDHIEPMCLVFEPGVTRISHDVCKVLHKKSEGNALFVKELFLSLLRERLLTVDSDGYCRFTSADRTPSVLQQQVPQNIHDLIQTRIDNLSPEQQLLIKVASVLRCTFGLDTLIAIHPSQVSWPQVAQWVEELQAIGLLRMNADFEVSFNHSLTQEVAYSLLTPSQKIELHRKAAHLIEGRTSISSSSSENGGNRLSGSAPQRLPGQVVDQDPSAAGAAGLSFKKSQEIAFGALDSRLAELAHHWMNGKVPDKARACLARLAKKAHQNYQNREAIRWLTLLLEQESECTEKSKPIMLSKWCTLVGESYFSVGEHAAAVEWLLKALRLISRSAPSNKLSKLALLYKEASCLALHLQFGSIPSCCCCCCPCGREQNVKTIKLHIRIVSTLSAALFQLGDFVGGTYYTILGANICERMGGTCAVSAEFYSRLAGVLGTSFSIEWARKFALLAHKTVKNDLQKVQVLNSVVPLMIWTCDPRAARELEEGLNLARTHRCWKELGTLLLCAMDHGYHHGNLPDLAEHAKEFASEAETREDNEISLWSCLYSANIALFRDDRRTAAELIRKSLCDFFETAKTCPVARCSLPILTASLIFRDIRWPHVSSPHLHISDLERAVEFTESNGESGASISNHPKNLSPQSSQTQLISRRMSKTSSSSLLLDTVTHFSLDTLAPNGGSMSSLSDESRLPFVRKLLEGGVAALPKSTTLRGAMFFHPVHRVLELFLLHGVQCNPSTVATALKYLDSKSQFFTIFRPMSLLWSAFPKLEKDPTNSAAFAQLHSAWTMAISKNLPIQSAFAQYFICRFLSKLLLTGKLSPQKIEKITGCAQPFSGEFDRRMDSAIEALDDAGHNFHVTLFSDFACNFSDQHSSATK